MLLAVVIARQRRRPQEVDRAVRADQAAAGEGRRRPPARGRAGRLRRRATAAAGRLIERVIVDLPVDGRSASDRSCWGSRLRMARSGVPGPAVPVASSPIAAVAQCRPDRPSWADARTPHRDPPRAAPGPRPAPRARPCGDRCAAPPPPPTSRERRGYHTYAEMVAEIQAAQAAHPDIVAVRSIGKSYQDRDLWVGQGLGQRRHRRERARGHVRFAPPRPRAPLARADPRAPALADRRLRHRRRGSPASSTAARSGSCSRSTPTAPSTTSPARPYRAWRKNRQPNAGIERHRHRPQPQLRLPLGLLRRLVEPRSRRRPITGRARSRRPRRGRSATSWPAAGSAAASRSRPRSRSTPPASRSSGRTATRRPTSRPT